MDYVLPGGPCDANDVLMYLDERRLWEPSEVRGAHMADRHRGLSGTVLVCKYFMLAAGWQEWYGTAD